MRSEITTIIFSKNRACQLDLLLRTLNIPATIIYTCDPEYQAGYDVLLKEHPNFTYVRETNFRKQFLSLIEEAKEYILFLVDDDILLRPLPEVLPEFEEFKQHPELICLSLRLSPTLRGAPIMDNKRWNWRKLRRSWGYPMSLSSHIFRTADILPILQSNEFDIPNDVEVVFRNVPPNKDLMFCVDEPFFVNIPANQVQTKYPFKDLRIAAKGLEEQYLAGNRISFEELKKVADKADNCFLRTNYKFINNKNMFEEYFKIGESAKKFPVEIPNVDREELAKLFCKLGFKRGAEIGTNEAVYTKILCENNPQAEIFGIDPQMPYVDFETPARQPHYDALFKKTQEILAPYNCKLIRKTSMEAVKDFEDGSLDFVYIDGDHRFEYVMDDIREWTKKVRVGGIISGHDWYSLVKTKYPLEVKEAVSAYVKENKIAPWYVLGRKETLPGEKRDKARSWMWFKKA